MVCECGADGKEEEGTGDVLVNDMQPGTLKEIRR